jgi:MYXO-CTERM domain-containing protein
MSKHRLSPLLPLVMAPALALVAPLSIPTTAQACGGTFCDTGPTAMPVDQTGENILFHIGDNSVEAHIQIQIDPNTTAEAFAWVIPVTALPEFEVGSQPLFDAMLAGSVPTYSMTFTTDDCPIQDTGNSTNFTFGTTFSDEGGTGDGVEETGGPDPNPEVVLQETVGAFEIAVLDGGTVEGVMQWLTDNGYQQDPAAEPILADYLAQDFLFVALKLAVDIEVAEVHPIVIRYAGVEPCVPIRLTRIAAAEDMDIRVFFLGEARVVPVNYRHVLVNPLKIDWFNLATNYKEVITLAVDAQEADGNAFVTEYAGASDVIGLDSVYNPGWDSAPYAALATSPVGVIEELEADGLFYCDLEFDGICAGQHPLIGPLLSEFIPVPVGLDAAPFYDCLSCYEAMIDLTAWDAALFAQRLDERIFQPGLNAATLVNENPYLTRMYTTISPAEMNDDPIFRANSTLPEVPSFRQATQRTLCDGSRLVTLPDGREVFFPSDEPFVWPEFQDEMPYEEDVDQEGMADNAPLVNLVDKTDEINKLLDEYNKKKGYGDIPNGCTMCSVGSGGSLGGIAFGLAMLAVLGLVRRRRQDG